ncbi:oligosaccharide flippase family protein [Burkholderiaceae bacterium UC74_6]
MSLALELRIDAERLRRAWWIHFLSSIGAVLGRFVIGVVLARLLAPRELGLFATASAIVGVAQLLRDLGVSTYIQREPHLDAEGFGACVGLQIAATAAVGAALLGAAELIADEFGAPALAPLIRILTVGLLLSPFSALMAALQLRAIEAARIAWVSRLGTLSWGLAAIGFAQLGYGATGLAWAQLLQVLACTLAYWPMRPRDLSWRPRWRRWRAVLHFGSGALGGNLLSGFNSLLPELLLGRLGGAAQVALLGRANAVVGSFQGIVGATLGFGTLPLMAQRHAAGDSLLPGLRRATTLLTGVAWPLLAWIVLQREALIQVLFGPAWSDSAGAMVPLALAAALALATHHAGLALTAIGRPNLASLLTAAQLAARLGGVALLYDGQLLSFAWALAAATVLVLPLQHHLYTRQLQLGLPQLLRASLPSLAVTAASALAALPWTGPLPSAAAALAVWLLALRLIRHPLGEELALQLARLRSTTRK